MAGNTDVRRIPSAQRNSVDPTGEHVDIFIIFVVKNFMDGCLLFLQGKIDITH